MCWNDTHSCGCRSMQFPFNEGVVRSYCVLGGIWALYERRLVSTMADVSKCKLLMRDCDLGYVFHQIKHCRRAVLSVSNYKSEIQIRITNQTDLFKLELWPGGIQFMWGTWTLFRSTIRLWVVWEGINLSYGEEIPPYPRAYLRNTLQPRVIHCWPIASRWVWLFVQTYTGHIGL